MKPKILLLTIQPPRMPGIGGELRTFYFVKAATEIGDVTLVSLGGPGGSLPVSDSLSRQCERVIQPCFETKKTSVPKSMSDHRIASLFRTSIALVLPWRNHWKSFLALCMQHCLPESNQTQSPPFRKRMLSAILNLELNILSVFFRVPPLIAFAYSDSFEHVQGAVQKAIREQHFDLIWIEHTLTYPFAARLISPLRKKCVPILLNSQNIEYEVCERVANVSTTQRERNFWLNQAILTRRLEQEAYCAADMVIQCSEKDAQLAEQVFQHKRQIVAVNGVDTDYFRPSLNASRAAEPTVVFTGSFGYLPNQEAVTFFVSEILPLIRKEVAGCRFVFAGSQANQMRHVIPPGCDHIDIYNSPADIRPFFEQAWVYVVPLRAGGGTRLKVMEAMAMERAIVSTTLGAEGIPCVNGKHLILADNPKDFAANVVSLLQNGDARSALESRAAAWVREGYSWKQICDRVKDSIDELV